MPEAQSAVPEKMPALRPQSAIDLWLGEQLRVLRKSQRRSLASVAQACGLSLGLLSQIERGLSSVSVKTLELLAQLYGVTPDSLLRNVAPHTGEADGFVARAGRHRRMQMGERGVDKEIFTPPAAHTIDLCRAFIAPGGSSSDALFTTDRGEHVGFIVEGSLELWIENRVVLLSTGDSFCYASHTPRRWRNPGTCATQVIWAISNINYAPP
ncbi:MAG: XRE family transcriptional regulator [Alcaligenaceae bacterium]|nr:MAG: XRE family transcriptional regulator [Alcaligenaceae bacterium]